MAEPALKSIHILLVGAAICLVILLTVVPIFGRGVQEWHALVYLMYFGSLFALPVFVLCAISLSEKYYRANPKSGSAIATLLASVVGLAVTLGYFILFAGGF